MDRLLEWAQQHQDEIIAQIRAFVECESPSGDTAALRRFADLVTAAVDGQARVRFKEHLTSKIPLPGRRASPGAGWVTLEIRLARRDAADHAVPPEGRTVVGPGSPDTKSGIAFFLAATRALRELDIPCHPARAIAIECR